MNALLERLQTLDSLVVYAVVTALVFTEDALLLGFVIPGETAAILGGVVASQTHAQLWLMIVLVVAAAVLGDTVGFGIGRRVGPRILQLPFLTGRRRLDGAQELLRRHGGPAVFVGRFVAFIRTVMPPLAGISGMPYRRFLAFNSVAALVFGVGNVLLGFVAGNSYEKVEKAVGGGTGVLIAVAVLAVAIWWLRRRRTATFTVAAEPAVAEGVHTPGG
ncbi:DedA family protein [Rhodococcus spelaei]|uniref:DedA family protein n=1 Tax=Rhodococcus spelaei TaxID=2546320 RepID=A0A541B9S5_9NOCA|nr:DedA family protein [Rhodococcus spelaei]TQF69095.1 DedA family protein [Rhodococcus spelaei]